ncbi:MAG: hypothetical protein AB7F21_01990 [Desulfuromonadales bacterium]
MKNQKRGFIGVILGLALLLLCGCGGGGGGGTDPIVPPAEPTKDPLAASNTEDPGRPAVAYNYNLDEFLVVSATTAADGTSKLVGIIGDNPFDGTIFPDDWTITIADLQNNATSSRPAVIFIGTHYCVVFQDGGIIYALLLDTSGNFVDGSKVILSTGDGNYLPVMAYDDDNLNQQALVVWVKYIDKSVYYYDLYSTLISFAPPLIVPERLEASLLGLQAGDQNEPAAAFDGTNYLVLWRQWTDTSQNITLASDIYGARVEATNGTVVGDEFPVSTATGGQAEPQLAFDDTTLNDPKYLAVWSDLRNSDQTGYNYDIYGTLISKTVEPDAINGNFPINTAEVPIQNFPTVTWNGINFVVAWANLDPDTPLNNGIYAEAVNSEGLTDTDANDAANLGFEISQQTPEDTLYIYPVASNYLITWVDLSGQSLLGDWFDIYYSVPL